MKYTYWFILLIIVISFLALVTSCADMPVSVGVQGKYGTYSYSKAKGVEIEITPDK